MNSLLYLSESPSVPCLIAVVFGRTHIIGIHSICINVLLELLDHSKYLLIFGDIAQS